MLVTGGNDENDVSVSTVQMYDTSGPLELQLPNMITPRDRHACGYMVNSIDQLVSFTQDLSIHNVILQKC